MNKNENYIMLNGKKIPLTDEQIKLIQADVPEKSPFDRADEGETYYYFNRSFDVYDNDEDRLIYDDDCYRCANYCTDENIMKQHALHMLLNNLLWRYSMTHGGDKIDWHDMCEAKYRIFYDCKVNNFQVDYSSATRNIGAVYFTVPKIAKAGIEEIVKPFIAAHTDFDVTKM